MRIRKFEPEDAKEVSRLISRALREVSIRDYSRDVIENVESDYKPSELVKKSNKRDIFVAETKERIKGTASLENNTIYSVFVDPEFHRKGIGRKLMEQVESVAEKRGIKRLEVPSSVTSVEFYRKLGYTEKKSYTLDQYGKIVLMTKTL